MLCCPLTSFRTKLKYSSACVACQLLAPQFHVLRVDSWFIYFAHARSNLVFWV